MANLPQELIDLVVGHVQSLHDARTLAAASLVSRSWRAASIGHLFLRIRFGLSITNRSNGIEAFTLFLSDPTHARIASCVKVLVIQTISAFESTAYLDLDALCALIPKLPKLSLVNITDIQIKVAATSVPRTSIPVRELQLGSVEVEHGFVGLAEVLTALRATHRLFIKHTPYGVDPPSSLPPPPARAAPFLALRTLAICKASDPLLQFFERAIASCARVQLMPYGGTFSFAALGAFVRALAPTLECLCVHGRLDSDKRQSGTSVRFSAMHLALLSCAHQTTTPCTSTRARPSALSCSRPTSATPRPGTRSSTPCGASRARRGASALRSSTVDPSP